MTRVPHNERVKILCNVKWKKGNLITSVDTIIHIDAELPQNILFLETPYQYFNYFFDDTLLSLISNETNLYSAQKNPNKLISVNTTELRRFIGICMYGSVLHVPKRRDY